MSTCCRFLQSYRAVHFIRVKEPRLVCLYYFIIALAICKIILVNVIMERGYEVLDNHLLASSAIKFHGIANTYNVTDPLSPVDSIDLSQIFTNSIFITTAWTQLDQSRGFCSDSSKVCKEDSDCTRG